MFLAINEAAMLTGILELSIFDSSPIYIRHIAFAVAPAMRATHEFVDRRDLVHVAWDSNDSINPSIVECVSCWRLVSTPFRWNYVDLHTMDSDTVRLKHL